MPCYTGCFLHFHIWNNWKRLILKNKRKKQKWFEDDWTNFAFWSFQNGPIISFLHPLECLPLDWYFKYRMNTEASKFFSIFKNTIRIFFFFPKRYVILSSPCFVPFFFFDLSTDWRIPPHQLKAFALFSNTVAKSIHLHSLILKLRSVGLCRWCNIILEPSRIVTDNHG